MTQFDVPGSRGKKEDSPNAREISESTAREEEASADSDVQTKANPADSGTESLGGESRDQANHPGPGGVEGTS